MLLRNVNGDHFEEAKVFNPLPFDEEPTKMGLFEETDGGLDPETGLPVPGEYTEVPTMRPKQMSHGSVVFIDLDGDGWLDIVTTGYCDGRDNMTVTGVEQGGNQIRFYRNLQNGARLCLTVGRGYPTPPRQCPIPRYKDVVTSIPRIQNVLWAKVRFNKHRT